MKNKTAMIFGVGGQDGSYLSELLLKLGYKVVGIVRRASTNNLERVQHLLSMPGYFMLLEGDITDSNMVRNVINEYKPSEIYNFAAQSHVHSSFEIPNYTFQVNTLGLLNILEAVRQTTLNTKIYQASTSEMFGNVDPPQGLESDFHPMSPYAVSKMASHDLIGMYRETYEMHIVSGILFNHESPRRGENFVTRKITKYFGRYKSTSDLLRLGSITSMRDWGFAPDYVSLIYQYMQLQTPQDFVLGTGISHSVQDFLNEVGKYLNEDWTKYVIYDTPENLRPVDVRVLCAKPDITPTTDFEFLVKMMVDYDNNDVPGKGKEYFMDIYGDTFSWRT